MAKTEKRLKVFTYVTDTERALIKEAADRAGVAFSVFVRMASIKAAKE